ncbi:MAG: CFI-box-CTERM domain-containing protein [Gammaproteobacteria bacterium]
MGDKDDRYQAGYDHGREGDFLSDSSNSISKGFSKEPDVYDKGYEQGAKDRAQYGRRGDDSGGGDSGGCFLTTACVEFAGLPDNCHELQTMRRFRDEYLRKLPEADALLADYCRTAPVIVRKIKAQDGMDLVFRHLLTALRQAVHLIDLGRHTDALEFCKREFARLRERYEPGS